MNETPAHFRLRDFSRLPKRQKKACWMLLGCALFLVASMTATVLLLIADAQAARPLLPQIFPQPGSKPSQQEPAFTGGALPEGDDAGQEYLDETLFVGDSNTVRMYAYGLVALENYMGAEGMGIESVVDVPCVYFAGSPAVSTIPEAIARVKPRRVVLTYGTNNASGQMSVETFIETYKEAIRAIQEAYPYCDVIVNAVPPVARVRAYPDITMETVDAFNAALLEMAQELEIPFLDTASALKEADGYARADEVIEDGIHLRCEALERVLAYVRTHPYETEDRRPAAHKTAKAEREDAPVRAAASASAETGAQAVVPPAQAPAESAPESTASSQAQAPGGGSSSAPATPAPSESTAPPEQPAASDAPAETPEKAPGQDTAPPAQNSAGQSGAEQSGVGETVLSGQQTETSGAPS